ncbi:MAG TPA: M3 family oligoendopeptidase [Anaerolineae bacterium]|nr:M3 family oligoendopeptidase [Anaerolineae bacterium]
MSTSLPSSADDLMQWTWPQIEPHYRDLAARPLNTANVGAWLVDWSQLGEAVNEMYNRLWVATTVNTADEEAGRRFAAYLDEIFPAAQAAEHKLKERLLASGLEPEGFEIPLRNMRTEAELFREANLPLLAEEKKLSTAFDEIVGAQTATWDGKEVTLQQLQPVFLDPDRAKRERAWRLSMERRLADREKIDELWTQFLRVRTHIAENASFGHDYRAYRWRQLLRFDYTPADCETFHRAIEEVAIPAGLRIYERRRKRLGVSSLRPWDLNVDPLNRPPLHPFETIDELRGKTSAIFHRVDQQLGAHFDTMAREGLLDLDNRKNKAGGGYCTEFAAARRPFIFMNAVGVHDDVQTLLHEGGHAFHVFESARLPYLQQKQVALEFAEVASMGMELLAAPYLSANHGGFYSEADAARARIQHLEEAILFWPYMAVVDAFQHWVYQNPGAALDPAQCDAQWAALWKRFMHGVDWSGLDDVLITGWQRKGHIHQDPLYYVEYGLAQLGAVQVWRNALKDQAASVARYRRALSLGGTQPLRMLYEAAGAKFAFETSTLREAVGLMEQAIAALDPEQG